MFFKNLCVLVPWAKVPSALEGLNNNADFKTEIFFDETFEGGGGGEGMKGQMVVFMCILLPKKLRLCRCERQKKNLLFWENGGKFLS